MKRSEIKLFDGSGGLNTRDDPAPGNPAGFQPNQFSQLANFLTDEGAYCKSRKGMELIQNAPIDPQPFVSDANTLGLWHFDDSGAPWTDSGPNGYNLNPMYTGPVSGQGLFPIGAGKATVFTPTTSATDYGPIFKTVSASLDGQAQLTIQGWINLNAAFSGQPVPISRFGQSFNTMSSGAILWGTCAFADDQINPGALINGLTINRNWDAVNGKNNGDPFVTFTLRTKGIGGTITIISSGSIPISRWVHVKGTYNSVTGLMRLWINGSLVATAIPLGGGNVDDSLSKVICVGAGFQQSYIPKSPTTDGSINQMASIGNTIYVVGSFSTITAINGVFTRKGAFAFDFTTGNVLPWNPNLNGIGECIGILNNIVYMGGNFISANGGIVRSKACAVDSTNGILTGWNPNFNPGGTVFAITFSGGVVYLGGSFTAANGGTARNFACAVDSINGTLNAWNPNLNSFVFAISILGAVVYLGGDFTTANGGTVRNRACAVDTTNGTLNVWNPNLSDDVNTLAISGAVVYLGGDFTTANGATTRNRACAVDTTNGTLNAWNPNLDSNVFSIAISNQVVFIGGRFANANGSTARNQACSVDLINGTLNGWNPTNTSTATITDLIIINSVIFMGFGTAFPIVSWQTPLYNVFNGTLDEWNIENAEVLTFPFKNPRGKLLKLEKSNGVNQVIAAADDGLYFTVLDGNWTKIQGSFSTTAFWDGRQGGDSLFLCNGIDSPKCWDGTTLRAWGENQTAFTLQDFNAGAGSGLTAGGYLYYCTFVFGSYGETGPGLPVSVTIASNNDHVILSNIPIGPEGCTARNIYRTKVGGTNASVPYLLRTIADNITTVLDGPYTAGGSPGPATDTGRDGLPDTTIGTGAYVQMNAVTFATAIPNFQFIAPNNFRMFGTGATNTPFDLFWSELGAYHVFKAANFVRASENSGALNGIGIFYSELLVSKGGNATLVLRGNGPQNWQQLEIMHPTVGCVDHWGYVQRYIPERDSYILCFPAKDGFYGYAGSDLFKISDIIRGTTDRMTSSNSSLLQWIETTQAQFQADAANGGAVSINIQCNPYNTDGLRQNPGNIEIVNQLNYLQLWQSMAPGQAPGKMIALCKGPAEGEFYFSTDGDNNLYHTLDNFQTAVIVAATPILNPQRFIELVYVQGIGASGSDSIYAFTSGVGNQLLSLVPSNAASGLGPGTFQYYYTFVNGGVETAPSVLTQVVLSALGQVAVNGIPIGPPNCTARKIYRTINGGSTAYLIRTIADNITTALTGAFVAGNPTPGPTADTGSDGVPDASLGLSPYQTVLPAGTSSGGVLYKLDDPTGSFSIGPNWILAAAGPFFYDADTPWQVTDVGTINENAGVFHDGLVFNSAAGSFPAFKDIHFLGQPAGFPGGKNIFITHSQALLGLSTVQGSSTVAIATALGLNTIAGPASPGSWSSGPTPFKIAPGFYGFRDKADAFTDNRVTTYQQNSTLGFTFSFFRRESGLWVGGSFRPQAFWDAVNQQLIFAASDAFDGNGNRVSHIYKLTLANILTSIIAEATYFALASDGTNCWFTDQALDPAKNGTQASLKKFALSNTAVITTVGAITAGYLPLRLVYNSSNTTLYMGGKLFNTAKDSYDFEGFLGRMTTAGIFTQIKTYAPNPTNGALSAYPVEMAFQTDAPNAVIAALQSVNSLVPQSFDSISTSNVVTALGNNQAAFSSNTVGIQSNLLFVPQSGNAGGQLWADRIYWSNGADTVGDGLIHAAQAIQLGLSGTWNVLGSFVSDIFNFGNLSAFSNFLSAYKANSGAVSFSFRVGATPAAVQATSFIPVAPGQKLAQGFSLTQPTYGQWQAVLTQSNLAGQTSSTPSIDFVEVDYYFGQAVKPRIVGDHFNNRTYWTVAVDGSISQNLVLVYQKNNSWTTYTNWNLKSMITFLGEFIAFQDYQLVQLEKANKDLGNQIRTLARTPYLIDDRTDKLIRDVNANVRAIVNQDFPTKGGYIKLTPYAGDTAKPDIWEVPLPAAATNELRQVKGVPKSGTFGYSSYCRSMAIQIETSDDTVTFVPVDGQQEDIQGLIIAIFISEPRPQLVTN